MDRTKWMREMVKGGGRIGQDSGWEKWLKGEDVLDRAKWMREMVKGGGRIGQDKVDERNG